MKKQQVAAVCLASALTCGICVGCDLVTSDPYKDYEQVVAEVNITRHADFGENGKYAAIKNENVITTAEITKRDLVAMFVSSGSSAMGQYNWSYAQTFDAIANSLINRQVYIQYAEVFFLTEKKGEESRFKDENGNAYTVAGFKAAVEKAEGDEEKQLAALTYFLTPDEEARALYGLRTSFNSSIDSLETSVIENRKSGEDEDDFESTVRTLPTGVDTENEDYFDADYRVYTGTQSSYGSYERIDDSTASTRRAAYAQFLSNLRSSGLLKAGEDTSDIENLSYFKRELRSAYEGAVIQKMNDSFEDIAAEVLTDERVKQEYEKLLSDQQENFAKDETGSSFTTALDSMSDTSFLLAAPETRARSEGSKKGSYGFVINILLPFSTTQTNLLESVEKDQGDEAGNKFVTRARILQELKATDQRDSWFKGETDYSFDYTEKEGMTAYNAGDATRKYLFFEDSLKGEEDSKYEPLKKYYGEYTYNGKVTAPAEGEGNAKYKLEPKEIDIDGFIAEMEGYLAHAGLKVQEEALKAADSDGYYNKQVKDYYVKKANGDPDFTKVDYSTFVYYQNKIEFEGTPNANDLFNEETEVYKAFSVINELSFAYNTDTAGLNSYLGYAVTPEKTSFVSEFEYASHVVCAAGVGNYIVVPSDYGWHIIYCTFSFENDGTETFTWDASQKETEGTFSYAFYEALKDKVTANSSSVRQTDIINTYAKASSTLYEERYKDLSELSNN